MKSKKELKKIIKEMTLEDLMESLRIHLADIRPTFISELKDRGWRVEAVYMRVGKQDSFVFIGSGVTNVLRNLALFLVDEGIMTYI